MTILSTFWGSSYRGSRGFDVYDRLNKLEGELWGACPKEIFRFSKKFAVKFNNINNSSQDIMKDEIKATLYENKRR